MEILCNTWLLHASTKNEVLIRVMKEGPKLFFWTQVVYLHTITS